MKILIISHYFFPINNIASVRVTRFAEHLKSSGHAVSIVSSAEYHINNAMFDSFYTYKDGRGVYNYSRRIFYHAKLVYYCTLISLRAAKRVKPDIILASTPPPHCLIAANIVGSLTRTIWVADVRDLWTDHYAVSKSSIRLRLESILEKITLKNAAAILTVSNPMRMHLEKKNSTKVFTIYNGYDERIADDVEALPNVQDNVPLKTKVQLSYTGKLYDEYQDVGLLVSALVEHPDLKDKCQIDFYDPQSKLLEHLIDQYQLSDNIRIHARVSYEDSVKIQLKSDVLILFLWKQNKELGVYPGKFFEYLASDAPILAIGKDNNEVGEVIVNNHIGVITKNSQDIYDYISHIHNLKSKGIKMQINQERKELRKEFSRKNQARNLENILIDLYKGIQ